MTKRTLNCQKMALLHIFKCKIMGPKALFSDFIVSVLLSNVFYFQCNSIYCRKKWYNL